MDGNQNTQKKNTSFRPWEFLLVFLVVFFLFAIILFAVDFVPEAPTTAAGGTASHTVSTSLVAGTVSHSASQALASANPAATSVARAASVQGAQELPIENPVRIQAPAVGIDTPVGNPSSTNADVLDAVLLKGAVRYPASGLLGENARMYIFAHQSYLPIVHNQAFKAFNGIQKLKVGDEIIVSSGTAAYHYRVKTVQHVNANDAKIEIGSGERTLTLSTCDSFGKKTDRNVVTADFVFQEPLSTPS